MTKNVKHVLSVISLFLCGAILNSCSKPEHDSTLTQLNKELTQIDNYLAGSSLQSIKDPRGVRMVIKKMGTGLPAQPGQTVDVDYVGSLFSTNTVFDQGNQKGTVESYIDGWQIALTTLPAGTQATLFIPSLYGYGTVEKPSIPANSTLVFDITFNKVTPTADQAQRLGSDTVAIDNYLTSKGITVTKDKSGIRYVITTPGTGATPTWFDQISLRYTFRLLTQDGVSIGPFSKEPDPLFYSRVVDYIPGMAVGLQKMQAGGKATLYVPSGLGFGTEGASNNGSLVIPGNANLIVEVELIEVK